MTSRDRRFEEASDDPFREIGATGLKRSGGYIDEEFLTDLKGPRREKTIRAMSENDPIIFGILRGIEMIVRRIDWRVEPSGTDRRDIEAAELVDTARLDMSSSWSETLSELLSMLPWGFSVHEIVYKIRNGSDTKTVVDSNGRTRRLPTSDYDDGRIGWRKLPIRSQESIIEWLFDESGGLDGVRQRTDTGVDAVLPIEKIALFRTTSRKNNPEGLSVLRGAYRPWSLKKTIEEVEAIGIERDLAGLPVGGVPAKWFSDSATQEERNALNEWKNTVRDLRRDRLEGVVKPNAYDDKGNPLFTLELLSTGGRRSIDVDRAIVRHNQEIATAMLADFIVLGHEGVGSFALSKTKTELFETSLEGVLDGIADVFNRHLIPRLLRLNGLDGTTPRLEHGPVENIDLEAFGKYVETLAGIGYPLFPSRQLEERLAEIGRIPPPPDDEVDFPTEPVVPVPDDLSIDE